MTQAGSELDALWLHAFQDVVGRSAHEIKDALNGVCLNMEVVRSRSARGDSDSSLAAFATAAANQLELLSARTEALLFLARLPKSPDDPADVAITLKHLATLLVPAVRADGGSLAIEGYNGSVITGAPAKPVRLALAAALLAHIKEGGGTRCVLQPGSDAVVRFSHESAEAGRLDPAVAAAIARHNIRTERSGSDLVIAFPGS